MRPCWSHSGRFLTLHKRRKKRPPTRAITSDQALLDDLYHGPTHVSFFFSIYKLNQNNKSKSCTFDKFILPTVCISCTTSTTYQCYHYITPLFIGCNKNDFAISLQTLLARISEWPFNAFALDRATGGNSIVNPVPIHLQFIIDCLK